MKKIILVISFISFVSVTAYSQSLKQRQADKLYNELAYSSAIELYEDLVKVQNPSEDNLRKIAVCHYNINDFKNAEKYYKFLLNKYSSNFTNTDAINYLQTLKYNGNYQEVEQALEILHSKKAGNLIYKNHQASPDYLKKLKKDSAAYKIYALDGINTENSEFSPLLFGNKKYMMLTSNRRNTSARNKTFSWDDSYFMDVYTSVIKDSLSFNTIIPLSRNVTSVYHDGPACLSADEKTLYLTRSDFIHKKNEKIVNLKLFIIRKNEKGELGEPESFPFNSDEYSIGHSAITKDGRRIYFVSDMPGGYGQTDIWYSEYENNTWQKPVNLGQAINTEGKEMFPYVYEDGTLFFSSDGRAGLGGLDIYFTVPALDEYFEPQSLGYPINTNSDDFGFYLNSDLQTGYFSSNRTGGKGKDDIYFFRSKNPILGVTLSGVIYDDNTKSGVAASVYLLNDRDVIIDSVKTDQKGKYSFAISDPSKKYKVGAKEKNKYHDRLVSLKGLKTGDNRQDIYLYPKYKLVSKVTDGKTNAPLEGVTVTLINKFKEEKTSYTTNSEGVFSDYLKNKKAGDKLVYAVKLEKKGYITIIQEYAVTLGANTIVQLPEFKLEKLELGVDIAKVIKINPIYFDYSKWNIRSDAALELDKIANVMKENPNMVIELGSHTDCRSGAAFNMQLSNKRSKSAAEYIISKGIHKSRIYGKGYGESKLINKCACEGTKSVPCTEEEHQVNRRTEFIVVKLN